MVDTDLDLKAASIRRRVMEVALSAGKGHVPPAFSWTEIAVALFYGGVLNLDPTNPRWADRDRFLLSKGHACLTLYVTLADLGFFPSAELDRFGGPGSLLAGHPDRCIPGVEAMSGSLGHGLGTGAGLALGARLGGASWTTFVVLGDGECDEGSVWEAAAFAGHHRLDNLIAIIDRNGLGATDRTENVLKLEPLADRWRAFGWDVAETDGHSTEDLVGVLSRAKRARNGAPHMVIARTVKGRGVSFMEDSPAWHHSLPKGDQIPQAMLELRQREESLMTEKVEA